jgi:hypothetical protein
MQITLQRLRRFLATPVPAGKILFYFLCAAPILLYLFLVIRYSINVPFNDEWGVVPLFKSLREGTLSLLTLWQPHNEHRSLLFYVSYLGIAQISGFNALAPLYMGGLLKVATLLMFYDLFRLSLPSYKALVPILTLFSAVFVFSAQEGEVVIWGFASLLFNMGAFFTILLFWALVRYPGSWKGTLIAAVAALGGSLISANGVFLWGLGLVGLLIISLTKKRDAAATRFQALFWIIVMGLFLFLYFRDYHAVNTGSSLGWVLHNKRASLMYFLSYMASLTVYYGQPDATQPIVFGALGLILFGASVLYLVWRKRGTFEIGSLYPWLLLPLYVIAVAAVTTLGRGYIGVWQSESSRYVSMSYPFWLSLFVLLSICVYELTTRFSARDAAAQTALLWGVAPVIIMLPIYVAYVGAFRNLVPFWHDRIATGLTYLYHYQSGVSPWFAYIYNGNPADIPAWAKYLDDNNLGPFAPGYRPTNDVLSETAPAPTASDYVADLRNTSLWRYTDTKPAPALEGQLSLIGEKAKLELDVPLDLCLADYDYLSVQAGLPEGPTIQTIRIYFLVNHRSMIDVSHPIDFPLMLDTNVHEYLFRLSALGYPANTRLNGIYIRPVSANNTFSKENPGTLVLRDLRLIHASQPSTGSCANPQPNP